MIGTSERMQLNRPAVIDETIDGEVVAVDLERGSYYSIRGVGVEIWHAFSHPSSTIGIARQIASRYGRPEAEIAPVVEEFVGELWCHGLLREADGDAAEAAEVAGAERAAGVTAATGFEPPLFEKFTDMEDLLLLDPVHDVDGRGWPHATPR